MAPLKSHLLNDWMAPNAVNNEDCLYINGEHYWMKF